MFGRCTPRVLLLWYKPAAAFGKNSGIFRRENKNKWQQSKQTVEFHWGYN